MSVFFKVLIWEQKKLYPTFSKVLNLVAILDLPEMLVFVVEKIATTFHLLSSCNVVDVLNMPLCT